jgi:hypothetical protein
MSAGHTGGLQQICKLGIFPGILLIFVVFESTGFVLRYGDFVTAEIDDFSLENCEFDSLQNRNLCPMCMDNFSDLYVPIAVIFCHNFSVKLYSDNIPRVYCLGHFEVIFRYEIRCIKIDN